MFKFLRHSARSLLVSAAPSVPFFFSYYLTLVLFSPPSVLLSQTLSQIWQGLSSLSSCSIRLQWVPGHSFLPGNELAIRGALLAPSVIPCSLPLFISDWGRTMSPKFFDSQVPSISTEELVLPRHVRSVLSRPHCNGHSLLSGAYLTRIGRIQNPSCGHSSQNTSHLILHCPATDSFRRSFSVSLRPLVQTLASCPASGAPWSSTMPPSLGRSWVTTIDFCFNDEPETITDLQKQYRFSIGGRDGSARFGKDFKNFLDYS